MSIRGHSRRLDDVRGMSAFAPIDDMIDAIAYGRDVPGTDFLAPQLATLLDQLIGSCG
jgi:hypothetical protein